MAAVKHDTIEKVIDEPKSMDEYAIRIKQSIEDFYYSNFNAETVEQIVKCSPNSFIAACTYARRNVRREDLIMYRAHKVNGATVQNEMYDPERLEQLAQIYLDLCFLYEKPPSVYCFSELTGVERQMIQRWLNDTEGVSPSHRGFSRKRAAEKIRDARAEFLQGVAAGGGKGTIGSIAILNNSIWKNNQPTREDIASPILIGDVPDLSRLEIPDLRKSNENNII